MCCSKSRSRRASCSDVEEVTVDIGSSDPLGWPPEQLRSPDLLAFAGIEPAEVGFARTAGGGRSTRTHAAAKSVAVEMVSQRGRPAVAQLVVCLSFG